MIEKLKELVGGHFPDWTPKVIADIGAHDGEQTLELAKMYPTSTVLALECYPGIWPKLLDAVAGNTNIIALPLAACDQDGPITFFKPLTKNQGYGSIFQPTGDYPTEPTPSEPIGVNAIRLDTLLRGLHIPAIELFWLDAQGSELLILQGLGKFISGTRVVWTEYMLRSIYKNQPLVGDLNAFLVKNGLQCVHNEVVCSDWWGDACFMRL
jgi:FkbM family methyltransferase